jgi:CRP-like cAMP-binding protein
MDVISLSKTALFRGITPLEVEEMLLCLGAEQRHFSKGEILCRTGDVVTDLGMVLSGSVLIENNDLWGNTTVLDSVGPGQIFAETYACTSGEPLMVNVVAAGSAEVLFLNMNRVLQLCSHTCTYHNKLIRNLLAISAQKNLNLSRKIFHTASKTIRGRLLSYLSYQAVRSGRRSFTIPFNRQQLADYLNVDRSALSNELSKMQKEGMLKVDRSHFELMEESREFEI